MLSSPHYVSRGPRRLSVSGRETLRQGQFLLRERRPVRPQWTCSCCWRLRRERDGGHLRPGAGVRKSERQEEKAGDNTRALTMDDEMG